MARAMDGADAVVHLAAKVSVSGPWAEYEEVNVRGTRVMVEMAKRAGIRDYVQISSPSVSHAGSAFMGQPNLTADPDHARGNYARSKAYGELLALEADGEDFRVGVIRPHLVWGPGTPSWWSGIMERASRGGIPLLDAGAALIDTTYVDNAATAIVRCLERLETVHGRPLGGDQRGAAHGGRADGGDVPGRRGARPHPAGPGVAGEAGRPGHREGLGEAPRRG
ncbi:hypothetical protein A5N15_09645 [Rothia kristinae]|uniref:NAD-dependent epimerase/dehydratase domain-containing protein n=1 Tax=Rothia kristinae TaxID=37923 RepID=A0A657IVV1_9MICC|nr:hypothetical protein A5N15_09645 [Rothia kristinae]